jgi:MarR family transcriptional regulator, transcriptional regulator for hemolysin
VTGDARALADKLGSLFGLLLRVSGHDDISLTATQRSVLSELFEAGPLRIGALAELIGAHDPTVSRAVDGLVAAGLVDRRPDPDDRRAVLVTPTAAGRDRIEQRRRATALELERALAGLSVADRRRLLALVERLVAELQAPRGADERRRALQSR